MFLPSVNLTCDHPHDQTSQPFPLHICIMQPVINTGVGMKVVETSLSFLCHPRESLTLCLWARHTHLLAVGTSKGNLLLYNHRTRR